MRTRRHEPREDDVGQLVVLGERLDADAGDGGVVVPLLEDAAVELDEPTVPRTCPPST